jgi:hypothetical protein
MANLERASSFHRHGDRQPDDHATIQHAKANALRQMGGSANLAAAVALYNRVLEIWEITH